MASTNQNSAPLENLTKEQLENVVQSSETLDQEKEKWDQERQQQQEKRRPSSRTFQRLKKSPVEIINRILFFVFLGSFLFSFISVYALNHWWFVAYIVSAFSCILYTPNRKALKELIAAWPNIEDLIKRRHLKSK
tara:strand:+ start:119 stop:523 length:405 start_codon:yes stop_codon:yes gene_type:complete